MMRAARPAPAPINPLTRKALRPLLMLRESVRTNRTIDTKLRLPGRPGSTIPLTRPPSRSRQTDFPHKSPDRNC
jgi:hypothetical protein